MSETETHIGKLKRVELSGKTQEEYAGEMMRGKGERPSYHKSDLRWMLDEYNEQYITSASALWQVIDHKELDSDDDINDLKENEDGTISFISRFYNGGTCLPEMLEEGLGKLNK